ncbi:MAG: flavin reductase family protein [Vulcanimicrobiaceae bacterium]
MTHVAKYPLLQQSDGDAFRGAMGHIAAGVNVITTNGVGGSVGLTVSSMCSLSLDPPSLLICVYGESPACAAIRRNRCFVVNVLSEAQTEIALCFAGQVRELRHDRFAIAKWYPLPTGAWGLPDTTATFDCLVVEEHPFGTHVIFIGAVQACGAHDSAPLLHIRRAFTKPVLST